MLDTYKYNHIKHDSMKIFKIFFREKLSAAILVYHKIIFSLQECYEICNAPVCQGLYYRLLLRQLL